MMGAMSVCLGSASPAIAQSRVLPTETGYRGLWAGLDKDKGSFRQAGGMATFSQANAPVAIYSAKAEKTFFIYGGQGPSGEGRHLVSYFDHRTRELARPTILERRQPADPLENPSLALDEKGYVWVFSNAHGRTRASLAHRSRRPFALDRFERLPMTNFSHAQVWRTGPAGFFFLHTRYTGARRLFWMTSPDGREWSPGQLLAAADHGHDQVSTARDKAATAFNVHPHAGGIRARTNLYYLESPDGGSTWTTASGEKIETPVTTIQSPALVHDYRADNLLVFPKDITLDARGRPIILFLTSRGDQPGPAGDPRTLQLAAWDGAAWRISVLATCDNNEDNGVLTCDDGGGWRVFATTGAGPQPGRMGGEVVLYQSHDEGTSWKQARVTRDSRWNHSFVRKVEAAHPDFDCLWADGDPAKASPVRLYFCSRDGGQVWRMPESFAQERVKPERLAGQSSQKD